MMSLKEILYIALVFIMLACATDNQSNELDNQPPNQKNNMLGYWLIDSVLSEDKEVLITDRIHGFSFKNKKEVFVFKSLSEGVLSEEFYGKFNIEKSEISSDDIRLKVVRIKNNLRIENRNASGELSRLAYCSKIHIDSLRKLSGVIR